MYGIHALISLATMRYGYRALYYRDDDIFSIYRAALQITLLFISRTFSPMACLEIVQGRGAKPCFRKIDHRWRTFFRLGPISHVKF